MEEKEGAPSTILGDDFVVTILLSSLSVSDLLNCRLVNQRWRAITNSDSFWIKKYIVDAGFLEEAAEIDPDDAPVPEGHYRELYLYRFAIDDVLDILKHNYDNTGNVKYLHKAVTLAKATAMTSKYTDSDGIPVILLNNVVEQPATYEDGSDSVTRCYTFNATATIYSLTGLRTVRIGIEYAGLNYGIKIYGTVSIVLKYEDNAGHMCKLILFTDDDTENFEGLCRVGDAFVRPFNNVCEYVMNYLQFPADMTPYDLISAIGQQVPSYGPSVNCPLSLTRRSHKILQSLVLEYGGLLQKIYAIEVAKQRFNHNVVTLLENTDLECFEESCGRGQPWLYGCKPKQMQRVYQLRYENNAVFKCTYSKYSTADICTSMELGMIHHMDPDPQQIKIRVGDQSLLKGRKSGKVLYIGVAILDEIVKQLDIPGLTHVDFFTYIIVAGNLVDQLLVHKAEDTEWWNLKSLEGIEFIQSTTNKTRLPLYQRLKDEAEKLRQEVNWDGRPPNSFKKWEYVEDKLEDDDCDPMKAGDEADDEDEEEEDWDLADDTGELEDDEDDNEDDNGDDENESDEGDEEDEKIAAENGKEDEEDEEGGKDKADGDSEEATNSQGNKRKATQEQEDERATKPKKMIIIK